MPNWAQVQTLDGSQTSGNTGTLTLAASFGSNVTIGNRILLFVGYYGPNSATADCNTPTSSPALTWTELVRGQATGAGTDMNCDIWTAVVGSTGSLQITVTAPGTASVAELGWTAGEYSGLDASAGAGCLDVSATGVGNGSVTPPATTSVPSGTTSATNADNQLAVAAYVDWGASLTVSAPSGFAKQAGLSRDAATTLGQCVATKTSASGSTEGGNFTYASTAVDNEAVVAVIKLATTVGSQIYVPPYARISGLGIG